MKNESIQINSPDQMWHAEISACRGANVVKLQYKGKNVFVPLENEKQWDDNPFVQGSPLLLPANRIVGGRFSYMGKEYTLPVTDKKNNVHLHGLLYRQNFSVLDSTIDSVVLQYENSGEIYPFKFCITAEYSLKNSGLKQKFVLQNCGETDMPYTFALHTTFCEPEYFSVPITMAQEKNTRHIPTGRYIPLSPKELKYASGCEPHGIPVSGYYKANGNTAVVGEYSYTVSDQFDHFVLFNAGGNSGYLCVEPQVGAVNGLNIPGGCRVICAGGKDTLCVSINHK